MHAAAKKKCSTPKIHTSRGRGKKGVGKPQNQNGGTNQKKQERKKR